MTLKAADIITAVSQQTALDVYNRSGRDDVLVIPHGYEPRTTVVAAAGRSGLVAFAGSERRKRLELLLEIAGGLSIATHGSPSLTVFARAGIDALSVERFRSLGCTVLRHASSEQVRQRLAAAKVLVATSSEEGFGLPFIEAAEHGTAVVYDRNARIPREVIGSHCVAAVGTDVASWLLAIDRASEVSGRPPQLSLKPWSEVAAQYASIY